MWGRIHLAVIPAKAGTSGRMVTALLHETPAFGVPTKYYFVGRPFAGVTACWSRHD
jgi:hypothetical protein